THLEDIGGNGVAGSVVGTLGSGGVSDADTLDGTGIVGGNRLALDDRYFFHAEHLAGDFGAAAQNPAQGRPLAHLIQKTDGTVTVTELDNAGIHGHTDGGPHLDGVETDVVVHEVEPGHGIKIVNAAVAAVGPDSLIFRLLGEVVAVLVVVDARALDDAATVAAVGRSATPFDLQFSLGFAGELGRAGKGTLLEVVGRIAAGFVENIGKNVGAVG